MLKRQDVVWFFYLKMQGKTMKKVIAFNESTIEFSENFPDKLKPMSNAINLEDYDLVPIPDYIPEEYRGTYEVLENAIEQQTKFIVDSVKREIGRRSEEAIFMQALSERLLSDKHLNQLKKSLAEFKIICCHPRFLLKLK